MRRIIAVLIMLVLSLFVGASVLTQQDPKPTSKPAKAVKAVKAVKAAKRATKPASFQELLRPFIGMKCMQSGSGDAVVLNFNFPPAGP